jgi:hypothetical protein
MGALTSSRAVFTFFPPLPEVFNPSCTLLSHNSSVEAELKPLVSLSVPALFLWTRQRLLLLLPFPEPDPDPDFEVLLLDADALLSKLESPAVP